MRRLDIPCLHSEQQSAGSPLTAVPPGIPLRWLSAYPDTHVHLYTVHATDHCVHVSNNDALIILDVSLYQTLIYMTMSVSSNVQPC